MPRLIFVPDFPAVEVLKIMNPVTGRKYRFVESGNPYQLEQEDVDFLLKHVPQRFMTMDQWKEKQEAQRAEKAEARKSAISTMTVPVLTELCKERGVEIPKGAKKADLIDLLDARDQEEGLV